MKKKSKFKFIDKKANLLLFISTFVITLCILKIGLDLYEYHKAKTPPVINLSLFKVTQVIKDVEIPKINIKSSYSISVVINEKNQVIGSAIGIGHRKLLTAAHLAVHAREMISNAEFKLNLYDINTGIRLRQTPIKFTRVGIPGEIDLAIAETEEDIPYFINIPENLNEFSKITPGDELYVIGAQSAKSPYHVSFGYISAKINTDMNFTYQISASVYGGNSGGGVYLKNSNALIGVLIATYRESSNISAMIPLDLILPFLN
jgi:hypothetical protein